MAKILQPSLSGGEMAPSLWGRVDVARYSISLAKCLNFVTRPTGGAVKRPGYRFNGEVKDSANPPRILPFVYSTEIKYLIEAGVGYMRFWIPAEPYGYSLLESGGSPVEISTPYTAEDLLKLRITQSADVLFIAGVNGTVKVPPKVLRRISATEFELADFAAKRGPFRSMNPREAVKMAATRATGNCTVTCNDAVFTEDMVGGLIYFEEKELRSVKPWTPLERNVAVGSYRRSDGKVYKATSVPSSLGGMGTPYYICGNDRPTHEIGRAFDGPQDIRNDGVNSYAVGVEWEYTHGSFGIVEITGFVSEYEVEAVVVERLASSVLGTAPAPAGGPWTFSGDGSTKTFSIPGAGSSTERDYTVVIDGSPISSNPYQPPTSGGGGTGGGSNVGDPGYYPPSDRTHLL
jgi:hypothetical protein